MLFPLQNHHRSQKTTRRLASINQWNIYLDQCIIFCSECLLPLSGEPAVMLCPLFFFLRVRSLAWEISLTAEARCSLLLPQWFEVEALESASPLSLERPVDLFWGTRKYNWLKNWKNSRLKIESYRAYKWR